MRENCVAKSRRTVVNEREREREEKKGQMCWQSCGCSLKRIKKNVCRQQHAFKYLTTISSIAASLIIIISLTLLFLVYSFTSLLFSFFPCIDIKKKSLLTFLCIDFDELKEEHKQIHNTTTKHE